MNTFRCVRMSAPNTMSLETVRAKSPQSTNRRQNAKKLFSVLAIGAVAVLQGCCAFCTKPPHPQIACTTPRDNGPVGPLDRVVDNQITMVGYFTGDPGSPTTLLYAERGCRLQKWIVRDAAVPPVVQPCSNPTPCPRYVGNKLTCSPPPC